MRRPSCSTSVGISIPMSVMVWLHLHVRLVRERLPLGELVLELDLGPGRRRRGHARSPTPTAATTPAPARRIFMSNLSPSLRKPRSGNRGRARSSPTAHGQRAGPGPVHAVDRVVIRRHDVRSVARDRDSLRTELELHVGPQGQVEPAGLILALGREGHVPLDLDPSPATRRCNRPRGRRGSSPPTSRPSGRSWSP